MSDNYELFHVSEENLSIKVLNNRGILMVENYGAMLTNFGDFYTGDKVKILLCGSTYYLVSRGDGVGITIPKSYIKIVKHKAKVINLFGGSGIGKSTLAAKLFSTLKEKGLECELVTEFAKDLVWEERKQALSCQPYVFGEQLRRQCIVGDKVDYIITDSPLLLSAIHDKDRDEDFKRYILKTFNKFDNINFLLNRSVPYNENGRVETEEQAKEIDNRILNLLNENNIN